jgi:hypothetical protein
MTQRQFLPALAARAIALKILCPLLSLTSLPLLAVKTHDFQIWNYDSMITSLYKRLDLYAEVEFRWRNNATILYYNHEHIELPIRVFSFLTIGPAYRQVWRRVDSPPHLWRTVYAPNLNITLFWEIGDFSISDRSRVTYLMSSLLPDVFQYRNKLRLYRPILKKRNDVGVFIDDEIFIEQKQRGIYQNRFSVGLTFPVINKIYAEVGYRARASRVGDVWFHDNILLLNLRANL